MHTLTTQSELESIQDLLSDGSTVHLPSTKSLSRECLKEIGALASSVVVIAEGIEPSDFANLGCQLWITQSNDCLYRDFFGTAGEHWSRVAFIGFEDKKSEIAECFTNESVIIDHITQNSPYLKDLDRDEDQSDQQEELLVHAYQSYKENQEKDHDPIFDSEESLIPRYIGAIDFGSLKSLQDPHRDIVSRHTGKLSLQGLDELSEMDAEALSGHTGRLDLSGLVSPSSVHSLSGVVGHLDLSGLKSLDVASAVALRTHQGYLDLRGLESVSDEVLVKLSGHEGDIQIGAVPMNLELLSLPLTSKLIISDSMHRVSGFLEGVENIRCNLHINAKDGREECVNRDYRKSAGYWSRQEQVHTYCFDENRKFLEAIRRIDASTEFEVSGSVKSPAQDVDEEHIVKVIEEHGRTLRDCRMSKLPRVHVTGRLTRESSRSIARHAVSCSIHEDVRVCPGALDELSKGRGIIDGRFTNHLSVEIAEPLSGFDGALYFPLAESACPRACSVLARRHNGGLILDGLFYLRNDEAKALALYRGPLALGSVNLMTDEEFAVYIENDKSEEWPPPKSVAVSESAIRYLAERRDPLYIGEFLGAKELWVAFVDECQGGVHQGMFHGADYLGNLAFEPGSSVRCPSGTIFNFSELVDNRRVCQIEGQTGRGRLLYRSGRSSLGDLRGQNSALSVELASSIKEFRGDMSIAASGFSSFAIRGLSKRIASLLGNHRGGILELDVNYLSQEVASILSQHEGGISLPAMKRIEPRVASALAGVKGCLYLDGVEEIDVEVAMALSGCRFGLSLRALRELDEESAAHLAGVSGELSLDGLLFLDAGVADALKQHKELISLSGLHEISAHCLAAFVEGRCRVQLRRLDVVGEEAAKVLGLHGKFDDGVAYPFEGEHGPTFVLPDPPLLHEELSRSIVLAMEEADKRRVYGRRWEIEMIDNSNYQQCF